MEWLLGLSFGVGITALMLGVYPRWRAHRRMRALRQAMLKDERESARRKE